uniref:Uncharacterized protein n=1 Tax=Hyaloperonospora arabidopsidis (strain Emoy2) TaxID=559515 RepID=M4BHX2_HYAAE
MATAVIAAATSDTQPAASMQAPTASSTKKNVLRSLNFMREADHRSLRAFTVVGLSRTIVAVCQKLGAEATVADSSTVSGINSFLKRCSDVYAELEVSNFQWDLASELVSELCVPLRTLLGKELFNRSFPIVVNSSVLQLLLLPLSSNADVSISRTGGFNSRTVSNDQRNVSALDDRLAQSQIQRRQQVPVAGEANGEDADGDDDNEDEEDDGGEDDESTSTNVTPRPEVEDPMKHAPELLRFAYHAIRLHSVRATSFLRVPSNVLMGSTSKKAAQWETALSKEVSLLQESRRQRKVTNSALAPERAGADAVWLRPRVRKVFEARQDEAMPHVPVSGFDTNGGSSNCKGGGVPGQSWALSGDARQSIKAHSSAVRCVSVDADEELLLTGSRHGSCRVWRLAGHPVQARAAAPTGVFDSRPILLLARTGRAAPHGRGAGETDGLAAAASASGVMLWDLQTSQLRMRLPFTATHEPLLSMATGLSTFDIAVATARRVVCIDVRTGPRVVAEWGADAATVTSRFAAAGRSLNLSVVAAVFLYDQSSYVALGTTIGYIVLLDSRTGGHVAKWQALDTNTRVVYVKQLAMSLILVVGADKEARVWRVRPSMDDQNNGLLDRQLYMVIHGVPEGITAAQISVHTALDTTIFYVASGARVYCARLPIASRGQVSDRILPVTVQMAAWPLTECSNSGRSSKSRVVASSIAVLPLRQLVLLGADDGCLKCVV